MFEILTEILIHPRRETNLKIQRFIKKYFVNFGGQFLW